MSPAKAHNDTAAGVGGSVGYRHLDIDAPAPGVLRCAMSNPPAHTLVAAEVAELAAFVAAAQARENVRVVVFTGGGEGVFNRHLLSASR